MNEHHTLVWVDRMPPLAMEELDEAQRVAAQELIAGPRKGVKGPFIPLLRSPDLLRHVQKLGEHLRFNTSLSRRVSEFATLICAREWTQQFEWYVHVPLALEAGTAADAIEALREGRRPTTLSPEEQTVYDFAMELLRNKGVSDATYQDALSRFSEQGVVELVAIIGYFGMVSMILNVAHTAAAPVPGIKPLETWPL